MLSLLTNTNISGMIFVMNISVACNFFFFAPERISGITYLERCSLCGNKHNWCAAVFMAGL